MWEIIGTIFVSLTKWYFQSRAKKKLSDAEFIKHIEAHQKRRAGVGRQATDFEDNMADAYAELEAERKAKEEKAKKEAK